VSGRTAAFVLPGVLLTMLMAYGPFQGIAETPITGSYRVAGGLPQNPQRPFAAQTCGAALARLAEAEEGSPLISARERAQVLQKARHQAEKLCPSPPETGD